MLWSTKGKCHARLNPTYRFLNAYWKHLDLVEWFKRKNLSNILSLNPFEMVHHNQVNKETNVLWRYKQIGDIDFEQSLFCSKIRGEEGKEERNTRERWVERASVICERKPRAARATHGFAARNPHVTLAVTLVLLSSLRSSPRISEQKRDCSQSIEDIKINNV